MTQAKTRSEGQWALGDTEPLNPNEVFKSEDAPLNVLRTQCRKERTLFLQEQALRKVIDGTTSIQEVLRVTTDPQSRRKK